MEISPPPPPPSSTTITTTAATTVKTPDPESEPPKQPIPPPFTNGVLKRHKPFNHHHQPLSPPVVVSYKECLKNHAATMGGHAVDGCGEFMPSPSSSPSLPTSLKCAACGCHRNFHRREHDHFQPPSPPPMQHLLEYQPHNRHQPPPPQPPLTTTTSPLNSPSSPPPISSSYYPSSAPHMLLALGSETNHYSTTPMSGKKRFRTKFTQAQKDKMHEVASKVGWKMQKRDEEMINSFCNEIGVDRNVFKVWMHNNKSTNKNITNDSHNENLGHGHASSNNNNIINVNNINGHDAIDFIMSRNINNNNNNNGSSHNDDVINGSNNNNNHNHDLHLVSGNVIKGSSSSC